MKRREPFRRPLPGPGACVKWAMKLGLKARPGEFYMPDGSLWWLSHRGSWECYKGAQR